MSHAERTLSLAIVGYGRMGRAIEAIATDRGHRVTARIDPSAEDATPLEESSLDGVDVALEFTEPDQATRSVRALVEAGVSVVSGTTGWGAGVEDVRALARERGVGFLWAPNFSLGMQLMFRLVERAAGAFSAIGGYDPYLFEEHHKRKKDAPSGTACRLAELLVDQSFGKTRYGLAPSGEAVAAELVPVAWVRAGEVPGTHRVGWDGPGETLEIVHRVRDRGVFAAGAVKAAEWLAANPGVHGLDDLVDDALARSDDERK